MFHTPFFKKINRFFFYQPLLKQGIVDIEKIQIMILYLYSLIIFLGCNYSLFTHSWSNQNSTPFVYGIFILLSLASPVLFWLKRDLLQAKIILGINIFLITSFIITSKETQLTMAILFISAPLYLFYLFAGFKIGLFFQLYFATGIIIRLIIGQFSEFNGFDNTTLLYQTILGVAVTTAFGIAVGVSLKKLTEHITKALYFDRLTGLPNSKMIQEHLNSMSLDLEASYSVIGIKLLNFNRINGNLGTMKADQILCELARRLKEEELPFLCRWSGTIFMAIVEPVIFYEVEQICRNILDKLSAAIILESTQNSPQFIVAVSRYPEDSTQPEGILQNVISLLDRSRRLPGDIIFYDEEKLQAEHMKFKINAALSQADPDQDFHLVYQPKIELATQYCYGAELLLRWRHREMGDMPPQVFIPLAEETGYIRKITRWVISQSFRQIASLKQTFENKQIFAINLSVIDLEDPGFLAFLRQEIEETGIDPQLIEFEVTEGIQADQDPQLHFFLEEIYAMGFKIAIDDFGTGYSNLGYLHKMSVHNLKIDKSFVKLINRFAPDVHYPVIDAIISLGKSIGLKITAEGVENREQEKYLLHKKCDYAQGWLYERPLTLEQYIAFQKKSLKKNNTIR